MRRYAVAPDHGRPSSDEPEASIGMSRTTHSMHGKTVLITGGTGGIDRAAAIGLLLALMHPIAWKNSRNFAFRGFSEVDFRFTELLEVRWQLRDRSLSC